MGKPWPSPHGSGLDDSLLAGCPTPRALLAPSPGGRDYGDTSTSGTESSFVDYDDLLVKKNGANWMLDGFESGLNAGSDPQSSTGYYACAAGLASLRTTDGSPDQWKRDVVYVGGRAIAEVDAEGIHDHSPGLANRTALAKPMAAPEGRGRTTHPRQLHTDHLGTPRIITAGSNGMTEAGQPVALGHVEGKQAFAPYGEFIRDIAWTKGYSPLTGYTGHVQQTSTNADSTVQPDPTGLIYMRGRYYSPAWHRFLNSDQGVDPNQFNQFAYVAGSPLQATDPSGMRMIAIPVCSSWTRSSIDGGPWTDWTCNQWSTRMVWVPDLPSDAPGGTPAGGTPPGAPKAQGKADCLKAALAQFTKALNSAMTASNSGGRSAYDRFTEGYFAAGNTWGQEAATVGVTSGGAVIGARGIQLSVAAQRGGALAAQNLTKFGTATGPLG